jgi:hypothetical protein
MVRFALGDRACYPLQMGKTGVLLSLLLMAGCHGAHQIPDARLSGFLGDYSQLRPGREGEALLVYVNTRVDLSKYNAVLLDPVTIWFVPGGDPDPTPGEEMQSLVNYLDSAMRGALRRNFRLVDRPGPGVMRIRVALTEAEGAPVVADIVSSLPPFRLVSSTTKLATGAHAFVGRASIEGEVTDALTGTRLLAAVDRRSGEKSLATAGEWNDVKAAMDYWAVRLDQRLVQERKLGYFSREPWER